MRSAQASYRLPSKNGSVAPRQRTASRLRTAPQQEVAPRPRPRRKSARKTAKAPLPNGLSVMGLLVVTLAAIGGMLVVSLNWQRNAHSLAQEEVALRSSLDNVADERQQLVVEERRAINPRFTAARAADAGLSEIKLDERTAMAKPAVKASKPVATTAAAKPLSAPPPQLVAKQLVPKQPAPKQPVKPAATTANANAAKPATTTVAIKAPQPSQKPERPTTPTMPPSIAKNASVKAALAR